MADEAFLGPGRTVVAAEPTFEAVLDYAKVTRAEAVKVPLTPTSGTTFRRWRRRATDDRPRLRLQPEQPDRHDRDGRRDRGLRRRPCRPRRRSSSTRPTTTSSRIPATAAPRARRRAPERRRRAHVLEDLRHGRDAPRLRRRPRRARSRRWRPAPRGATRTPPSSPPRLASLARPRPRPAPEEAPERHADGGSAPSSTKQGCRYIPSEANFVMIDVGRRRHAGHPGVPRREDPRRPQVPVAAELAARLDRHARADGRVRRRPAGDRARPRRGLIP